jgi:hypothetical protein
MFNEKEIPLILCKEWMDMRRKLKNGNVLGGYWNHAGETLW